MTEIRMFACIEPEVVARFINDELSSKQLKENVDLRVVKDELYVQHLCSAEIELSQEEIQFISENSNSLIESIIKKAIQAGFQLSDQL